MFVRTGYQLNLVQYWPPRCEGGCEFQKEVKFLGLVFDKKLDFKAHVKYLKEKCRKALNILRVVGHTDWGADKSTLLKLCRTLVRSKLDYGCAVYGSTKNNILKLLDPIHHQGLRIALGAFRTSPVQSLYAEAGEPTQTVYQLFPKTKISA